MPADQRAVGPATLPSHRSMSPRLRSPHRRHHHTHTAPSRIVAEHAGRRRSQVLHPFLPHSPQRPPNTMFHVKHHPAMRSRLNDLAIGHAGVRALVLCGRPSSVGRHSPKRSSLWTPEVGNRQPQWTQAHGGVGPDTQHHPTSRGLATCRTAGGRLSDPARVPFTSHAS